MSKFDKPIISDIDPRMLAGQTMNVGTHTWRLSRMLEASSKPESNEGKQIIERMLADEFWALSNNIHNQPEYIREMAAAAFKEKRELLKTEAIESTTLIDTEFTGTLLEGAEPVKIMRQAVPSITMRTNAKTYTLGETGGTLPEASEAGELKQREQDYSTVTFTSKKYGAANFISRELVEDGEFDVIAIETRKMGARAENTLNEIMLATLLDDAGNEHDTTGSNQGYLALASARKEMKADGYSPDIVIMSCEAEAKLATEGTGFGVYYGSFGQNYAQSGNMPTVLGMRPYVYDPFTTDYASSTYTWGYAADGEIGMVCLDTKALSAAIGMRRDITTKPFEDPIRDLTGQTVTLRFATESPFDNGICRVEY